MARLILLPGEKKGEWVVEQRVTGTQPVGLLESIFDAALHPERFDELEASWEEFLDASFADPLPDSVERQLSKNISNALELLERLERLTKLQIDAGDLVAKNPGLAAIVNDRAAILARNDAFIEAFPDVGQSLSDPDFASLRKWCGSRLSSPVTAYHFTPVMTDGGSSKTIMAIPIKLPSHAMEEVFFLTELDILMGDHIAGEIVSAFGLTEAEAQVAIQLSNGSSPQRIALDRGVSINTVRAQIKMAIEKVGARGTTDLVRTLCGLAARVSYLSTNIQARDESDGNDRAEERQFVLRDGRRLACFLQGDDQGRPILFLHSLFEGPLLYRPICERARSIGLKVIAPSRPGFGRSDQAPRTNLDASLSQFGSDALELLDQMEIERCVVVGQHHALRFAAEHGDRIQSLVHHNAIPIWHDRMLESITTRRRTLIKTSIRWPAALRLLVRIAISLVESGREDTLLRGIASGSKVNIESLEDPGFLEHARSECRHNAAQGPEPFLHEVPLLHKDMTADIGRLSCPVWVNMYRSNSHVPDAALSAYREIRPCVQTRFAVDYDGLWSNLFEILAEASGQS